MAKIDPTFLSGQKTVGAQTIQVILEILPFRYLPPAHPCFSVCRGNKGLTGELRVSRGNRGVRGEMARGKRKCEQKSVPEWEFEEDLRGERFVIGGELS